MNIPYLSPENMSKDPEVNKAVKKTTVYAVPARHASKFLSSDILKDNILQTLEGPRPIKDDDIVLFQKKGKGKYWAVSSELFKKGFLLIVPDLDDELVKQGWTTYCPKDPVRAWVIPYQFKVKALWGDMESELQGGMLVQKHTDEKDIWIASFEDWGNYTILDKD